MKISAIYSGFFGCSCGLQALPFRHNSQKGKEIRHHASTTCAFHREILELKLHVILMQIKGRSLFRHFRRLDNLL